MQSMATQDVMMLYHSPLMASRQAFLVGGGPTVLVPESSVGTTLVWQGAVSGVRVQLHLKNKLRHEHAKTSTRAIYTHYLGVLHLVMHTSKDTTMTL